MPKLYVSGIDHGEFKDGTGVLKLQMFLSTGLNTRIFVEALWRSQPCTRNNSPKSLTLSDSAHPIIV